MRTAISAAATMASPNEWIVIPGRTAAAKSSASPHTIQVTTDVGSTLVDEGILKNMGDEAVGVYSASWYTVDRNTPDNKRFVESIQREYKVTPGFYTAGTYTAGLWLEEAVKRVKGKVEDKPAFIRALHEVKLEHGPMGPIRLGEHAKPILNIYIRRVERKDGQLVNTTIATRSSG